MASRSTDVVFHNQMDSALVKSGDGLDHGIWTAPWYSPGVIGAHADGEWRSESDGVLTGTEGHVSYRLGSTGMARTRVTSVSRRPGQLDLFVVGSDGVVSTAWWTAGQEWSGVVSGWRPIGGFFPPDAPIAAVCRTPDNIDLFVVGNDGVVYTSWWAAGSDWSGIANDWRPIGGTFPAGAPLTAVARTANNLDVFVAGNDGVVYTSWWFAGSDWSGVANDWRPIGGTFPAGAPLTAVARTANNLDVFVTGNDGVVYTSWWAAGADWSGIADDWRGLGGVFPSRAPVSAVARTGGNLDLFVMGNDGVVYTSWWSVNGDWSGVGNSWRPIGGYFPVP